MDTSATAQMAENMEKYEGTSGSSEKEFVWTSPCRTAMGETVRKGSTRKRMGEGTNLGMPLRASSATEKSLDPQKVNANSTAWSNEMERACG